MAVSQASDQPIGDDKISLISLTHKAHSSLSLWTLCVGNDSSVCKCAMWPTKATKWFNSQIAHCVPSLSDR